ncbi:hypothetical protein Cs7R123_44570 [Catellatospora sp. TT07R-123]|nr:hypothetical protein Cs7R123_44570 [Catellatospora sp. TT07R-123]
MDLAADGRSRTRGAGAPGGLPVTVTAVDHAPDALSSRPASGLRTAADQPAAVQVEVLGKQQADAVGAALLMRVSRTDGGTGGAVRLGLDYSSFAHAYGADWAWRLRLSQVPQCALSTPPVAACGVATPLASVNDGKAGQVSAEIALGQPVQETAAGALAAGAQNADAAGVVVAMSAGATSEVGNFTKSDLKQSSSWSAGGSAGNFNYSYPIEVPPVPGGLAPQVALTYSSGAVDGQTAGGNTQPSVIGEGWAYSPGFIERAYRPCAQDGDDTDGGYSPLFPSLNHGDLCWRRNNAAIMLNGKSSDIVWGDDGTWRLKDGDGEKVELLHGASGSNQDLDDNEYWKVTTRDGTQYFFGLHTMRSGNGTGSVQWVPVFANHTGEPCQNTTGVASSSRCSQQAMRWMLDYVLDRNNNEMTLFYTSDSNKTALNGSANTTQNYRRDIQLARIEYGTNKVHDAATVKARAQVAFTYSDRCVTASCSTHDEANWPDTPWDLDCTAAPCSNNMVPSFWSTKRLTKIETQVLSGGVYATVDEWALEHSFPSTGTSLSPVLWLNKITHTGKVGGTATLPSLQFPAITSGGGRSQNRADYDPGASMASHMKYRIVQIKTETGKQIDVTYSGDDANNNGDGTDCVFGGTLTFPNPDVNAHRCFPQLYTNPSGSTAWTWWHKRVVTQVVESDLVGGSPPVTTTYAYSTASSNTKVLWAHDDGAAMFSTSNGRSWGNWRGYTDVTVTTGPAAGTRSQTSYLYFRGLYGDSTDTGTRSVTITDGMGLVWYDLANRTGHQLQETTYDQAGGTAVQRIRTEPWELTTGTRTLTDWTTPAVNYSYITRDQDKIRWEWTGSGWSTRDVVRQTFSTTAATAGRLVDRQQEYAPGNGQDTCIRYTYADAPTANMYSFLSREQTVKKLCSVTPTIPADLLSDTRNYYDNGSWGAAPSRGNVTKTDAYGDTGWITTSQNLEYDDFGQLTSAKDALGRQTTTTYAPNGDGLTQTVTATNGAGYSTITSLNVHRGLPATVTDANGKVTTGTYDPLGRLTSVTKPGNASGLPDVAYTYSITGCPNPPTVCSPSWVRTDTLGPNDNQISSYEIYDGLLRIRQVQTTAPDSKRVVNDTTYDQRGLAAKTSAFYNNASGPTSTLLAFNDVDVDRQSRFTYDGRGRKLTDELWSLNTLKWKTSTAYQWDRTSVTPPTGGTATQDVYDDRGNVVEKRLYHGATPAGAYDTTTYGYNLRNELTSVSDAAGNDWTYTFDLLGRKTAASDPDTGTTQMSYDNAGQLTTSTDGRGQALTYVYDNLGRKTKLHNGTTTAGPLLASWTYDTVDLGQLTSSTRYDGSLAYVVTVSSYDDGYRPESVKVTVPVSTPNGALAADYTTVSTYTNSGAVKTITPPLAGGLPAETITTTYTNQGLRTTVKSGIADYISSLTYRWDGAVKETVNGTAGKQVRRTNTWDAPTPRLTVNQIDTENQATPGTWVDRYTTSYGYDDSGNVTAIAGKTSGITDQVECFNYDYQRRMTKAWTEATWSCTTPQRTGSDPYWREWSFDVVGNRLTQTDKVPSGTNTSWTYTYPTQGTAQPHALDTIVATGPLAGTPSRSFDYDTAGHTSLRQTETGATQNLTWDAEGHLATLTQGGNVTSYLYDADGNRLISRAPTKTVLYLGDTELELPSGGSPLGTRYYEDFAVRNSTGLTWTGADNHGTQQIQINSATLGVTRNRTMPFGEKRGAQGLFVGTKGFVGGTLDDTGLTHLGAREYDAGTGRFISVDPIIDLNDPRQWHGYAYSGSNPATYADPTGLIWSEFYENDRNDRQGLCGDGTVYKCAANYVNNYYYLEEKFSGPPEDPDAFAIISDVVVGFTPYGVLLDIKDAIVCANDISWSCSAAAGLAFIPLIGDLGKQCVRHCDELVDLGEGVLKKTDDAPKVPKACNSFDPDTPVLMADGTTKKIKDVGLGDEVLASDPETGETRAEPVTQLHLNDDTQLTSVMVDDGHGSVSVLETTWEHPFWSVTREHWVPASVLRAGEILSSVGGDVAVQGIRNSIGSKAMHNLTVAEIHTYYVLAGNSPVLVHNTNGCPTGELSDAMRDLLAKRAGFTGGGQRYILDENLSPALAELLRAKGINVRGVKEMGLGGTKDPQLLQLAEQLGAKIITRDRGRQMDGGFGDLSVNVDRRVTTVDGILRILLGR